MHDRPVIYSGLLVFLVLFTFPVWRDLLVGATTKGPQQSTPRREKECVAPLAYMRTSHMTLLTTWRDEVVRSDRRDFEAFNGKKYSRNLTSTCLEQCHGPKADFCDRCHNYAAVQVTCWECHLDGRRSGLVARRSAR
jgi:hypothetical protein